MGWRTGTRSWLIPGKASYSPMMPMTGSPLPKDATKAVGISATPHSTAKPWASSSPARSAELFSSRYPSSARSQISMAMSVSRS